MKNQNKEKERRKEKREFFNKEKEECLKGVLSSKDS